MIGRRQFITLLGGAAATWPLSVRAQSKLRTIGYLGSGSPSAQGPWIAAFVQRMRELGWIEGATFVVENRWAEGRSERYAEIAAEFVRLNVAVILTEGGCSACGTAGNSNYSDCLRGGGRSGRRGSGSLVSAAGRQCYRSVNPTA